MSALLTIPLRSLQARELIDPRGASHDGTTDLLTTFERHYRILRNRRATTTALMSEAPHDGRPPVVSAGHRLQGAGVTNGQEVRQSERWSATPLDRVTDSDGQPLDWTCYSISVDGRRVPFIAPERPQDERRATRKGTSGADVGRAYSTRLAALGADVSLASGDS